MNPKILRAIKHLSSLADHETLFVCKPILLYKDELQQHWKDLHEQVSQILLIDYYYYYNDSG